MIRGGGKFLFKNSLLDRGAGGLASLAKKDWIHPVYIYILDSSSLQLTLMRHAIFIKNKFVGWMALIRLLKWIGLTPFMFDFQA